MPILIDGHNLIGRLPTLSLADPDDEAKLVQLLLSYQARTGKAITVVFDPGTAAPWARTRQTGKVQAVFAPPGSSADALITRRVRKHRNPGGLLVVTSDRALQEVVQKHGARVRSADDFAVELGALGLGARRGAGRIEEGRDNSLSPEEIEKWLDLFEHGEDPAS